MGSQLQLCTTVGSQLIGKMHKVLVASCLAAVAFADAEPGYLGYGYGYGIGGVSRGVGLHPTGSVYESRSTQGLGKRSAEPGYLGYGIAPYGYAIGGVSTGVGLHQLDQFMSTGLPRVLVREVLMLSQVITHRTIGPQLSPPMDTPPAMDAVVSAVLSQDILVLAMGMDMVLEVSAEVLVSTQLGQSMNPDQHRVSVVDTCTRLLLLSLLCNMLEINIFLKIRK